MYNLVSVYAITGWPMQVGNMSSAYNLNWYQDRSASTLPQAWVVSVPLMVYRVLMLLWALWLAFSLLKWLTWAGNVSVAMGYGVKERKKRRKKQNPLTLNQLTRSCN